VKLSEGRVQFCQYLAVMVSASANPKDRVNGCLRGDLRRTDLQESQGCGYNRWEVCFFAFGRRVVGVLAQFATQLRQ
jgi:hypothetical protein